jgi:hypothetical protein
LDSWALLNDAMDTLAKAYWLLCHRNDTPTHQYICHDEWAMWISQEKICKNFKQAIRDKIQQDRLETWLTTTKKLAESQINQLPSPSLARPGKIYGLHDAVKYRDSPPTTRRLDRICEDGASGRRTDAPDA